VGMASLAAARNKENNKIKVLWKAPCQCPSLMPCVLRLSILLENHVGANLKSRSSVHKWSKAEGWKTVWAMLVRVAVKAKQGHKRQLDCISVFCSRTKEIPLIPKCHPRGFRFILFISRGSPWPHMRTVFNDFLRCRSQAATNPDMKQRPKKKRYCRAQGASIHEAAP
jgi:hypothetical protein